MAASGTTVLRRRFMAFLLGSGVDERAYPRRRPASRTAGSAARAAYASRRETGRRAVRQEAGHVDTAVAETARAAHRRRDRDRRPGGLRSRGNRRPGGRRDRRGLPPAAGEALVLGGVHRRRPADASGARP